MRFQCKVAGHFEALWKRYYSQIGEFWAIWRLFSAGNAMNSAPESPFIFVYRWAVPISGNCTRFWAWPAELFISSGLLSMCVAKNNSDWEAMGACLFQKPDKQTLWSWALASGARSTN